MKATTLVLLAGCLSATFVPALSGRPQGGGQEPEKKSGSGSTSFFQNPKEATRLNKEVDGSWMLFEYTNPSERPLDDSVNGFATFHDGFVTILIVVDAYEQRMFRTRKHVFLDSGVYRYRFNEHADLQIASVMSFSNDTEDGDLQRDPAGRTEEYYVKLEDGLLQLRDPSGVLLSFRRVEAGEFPATAVKKLEGRRGGADAWEKQGDEPR